jgi:hypothetical protein
MFHWTDQKIRVHTFYCVLALTVAHLMRRHADQAGLHMSVRDLLSALAGIQETILLHHDGTPGRPSAQRVLTDMDPTERRLYQLFDLDRHAPRTLTSRSSAATPPAPDQQALAPDTTVPAAAAAAPTQTRGRRVR